MGIASILAGIFLICCIVGAVSMVDGGDFIDALIVVFGLFVAIVVGLAAVVLIIGGVAALATDDTPNRDTNQSQEWES